jgi:hypothetical protein
MRKVAVLTTTPSPSIKKHDEHKQKANHDKDLAELLCNQATFPDWAVICSFYSALHSVDAYAHKRGVLSFEPAPAEKQSAHQKRLRYIDYSLKEFFGFYEILYNHCRQCRYDPEYFRLMTKNVPDTMLKLAKRFLTLTEK